jgi:peptide/nickel transport system permease protein
MQSYITARVLTGLITLFAVSIVVFGLLNLVPGDPLSALTGGQGYTAEDALVFRHQLGLDRPLPVRYANWLGAIARGDLGKSIKSDRAVTSMIGDTFPVTLELALITISLGLVTGIPLGVWSAVRQDRVDDYVMRLVSIAGLSLPSFWLGTMVVVLPALWWGWVPPLLYRGISVDLGANLAIMVAPAVILAAANAATLMRITRTSVLEVLREDYVRTARAKGLSALVVLRRYVVRNSILPVLTIIGGQIAFIFSTAVVVETIFNLPGVGTLYVQAIHDRDYPVITGVNLLISVVVVASNLVIDLLYRVFDPRIAY